MRKLYTALLSILLVLLLAVGVWSFADEDATISPSENRALARLPEFSWSSLLDGSFFSALDTYYTDHFPAREQLLQMNRQLNRFYAFSAPGAQDHAVLILDLHTGAEQGGEALRPEDAEPVRQQPEPPQEQTQSEPAQETEPPQEQTQQEPAQEEAPSAQPGHTELSDPEPALPPETEPEDEQPPEPEKQPAPTEEDARWLGNVVIFGTRAMEVPYGDYGIIESYAEAVASLDAALGEDVRTISLLTPNGAEFYTAESMHTGLRSQKDMIAHCYESMPDSVVTVDAYSQLAAHQEEYIYFRTDHHWTQLGAYYAYRAFCESAGFEAVELDRFETGRYDRFVGSMYTFTSEYPQSQILRDNPDYLDYYLPIVPTHAEYFFGAGLKNGVEVSVVYEEVTNGNKYLCFIGGDHPVTVIDSETEGPVCLVLKESYGNAFVPFLTSHYSRIIVVDPREFNREGQPTLDLAAFAAEQGVNDLIVINYPYMINSTSYIGRLNSLVSAP